MIGFEFVKDFAAPCASVHLHPKGTIPQDCITAVLGKSGSGKSTLALMMAGLLRSDRGFFRVGETVFEDGFAEKPVFCSPQERGIGFVFQNHRLFPCSTVRENILFGTKYGKRNPRVAFDDVVELLHLGNLLDRIPATLSGGQAQRVSLARALLAATHLLIMDEATASLDPELRSELTDYVATIPQLVSLPVLYITHHVEEAAKLSKHCLVVDNGIVAASGKTSEILKQAAAA